MRADIRESLDELKRQVDAMTPEQRASFIASIEADIAEAEKAVPKTIKLVTTWKPGGVVHRLNEEPLGGTLAWCGMRPQFRHKTIPGTRDEVTCAKCKAAMKAGQPRAFGS